MSDGRLPIERIVLRLAEKVRRDPSGAASLSHLCVVVPTAQSGRRLRLALATHLGAVIPPLVKTPLGMMLDEDDPSIATRTDELIAFRSAIGSLDGALERARVYSDLRDILAVKALSFADVASALETDRPDEAARWHELARIETRYNEELAQRGKRDRIAAMKAFKPDFPGVEEIIRLDDPALLPGDEGIVSLAQIRRTATPADEAEKVADYFASIRSDEAMPALCVADPEMFPEIVSAMKAKGLTVHDPSRTSLASSSLGHLVGQLTALSLSPSYSVFSAFIRGGDVRRWLMRELGITSEEMSAILVDLDNRQAEFLPEMIDDIAPKTSGKLRAVFEFVKVQVRKHGLRYLLGSIFRDRLLDESQPEDREFVAAAEAVSVLIDECGNDAELLALRLEETTYSLEPDEGDIIISDGWMELPFLSAREVVIVGFREGCVPESTVGHPYLPDSLRRHLGLPDNAWKERRDRAIFRKTIGCRAPEAVSIFYHSIDANGDVLKPSRLLFETPETADLVQRVRLLYGAQAGTAEGSAADLPASWRLKLPIPPRNREIRSMSPTRLDNYLRCPFTAYLKEKDILGDKRLDDRAEELEAWEFGNLAHEALEAFGSGELRDSTDATVIADFLAERVDAQLVARFGTAIPAIVSLQGESVKRRLAHFSVRQAERRRAGWKILSVERKMECLYGHTRFHGKVDRIDFNEQTGEWCVIDYKTWDSSEKAEKVKSLQLALYCAMLDACDEEPFGAAKRDRISACYCLLGSTADDVLFTKPVSGEAVPAAEVEVRRLIERMERGIYWPPSNEQEWRYSFADWLSPSPQETVDSDWIADQEARLG